MATNDDLDDFFKKKDRKGNKHKKPTGLLTNNEELLKQLVIVTSATSAFKDNMDFNDDDDDEQQANNVELIVATTPSEDTTRKHPKTKLPDAHKHLNEQQMNISSNTDGQQQQQPLAQDEWEEFEDWNSKYEQLRSKFAPGSNPNDDNDDEYYDNENNPNNNDNNNEMIGDREQQKDKPVWKINQIKEQQQQAEVMVEEKIPEAKPSTTTSTGAYRPPAMRDRSSVQIVSGSSQRVVKKKEPNLASADEFPTLGATANKK